MQAYCYLKQNVKKKRGLFLLYDHNLSNDCNVWITEEHCTFIVDDLQNKFADLR